MANQLKNNPWYLDTAGGDTLYTGWIKAAQFEFYFAAEGDSVTIEDSLGNPVWSATGNTTNDVQRSGRIVWICGLNLSAITAGDHVLAYIE